MRKLVTRFAPSPSYYAHIGHLRGLALLKKLIIEEYKGLGKVYLRFDDTGNEDYRPEYYRSFLNLFKILKIPLAGVIMASKRKMFYINAVIDLIKEEKAYICSCKNTTDKKYRDNCGCFGLKLSWDNFEKNQTVRFKSSREVDYVICRHLEDGTLSPTLALQSAVDDKFLGVNFLYRGSDLESSQPRLREIYLALKGSNSFPKTRYWGRIQVYDSETDLHYEISKSKRCPPQVCPGLNFLLKTYKPALLEKFLMNYGDTKNNIKVDLKRLRSLKS